MTTALEVSRISKRFGGLVTLEDVSLQIQSGERRALLGPNGAGKTTLLNIISGLLPPTSGSVYLHGRDMTGWSPNRRAQAGLGRTFQITNLLPNMTVQENVALALQSRRRFRYNVLRPWFTYREVWQEAERLLEAWAMTDLARAPVATLAYGDQRKLEIIMVLATGSKVLLLDEPAAGLSASDTDRMAELIEGLDPDLAILFIEHDIDMALRLAHRVTVLHGGRIVAEGTPDEIRANRYVQDIYLGVPANA
jgi:branched-chain amino acid transport system ATP-binding protein